MERTLRVLLQRDTARDRLDGPVPFEGYEVLWPDGRPLSLGFDAFCKQGQRLLGLGRHMNGHREQLVDMLCIHLAGREEGMSRLPGHRVRRFCMQRTGRQGRLHFLDGTPTAIVLDLDRDEQSVLEWVGLTTLDDGDSRWFDLAARTAEPVGVASVEFVGASCPTIGGGLGAGSVVTAADRSSNE
jgi:hypothetical protein